MFLPCRLLGGKAREHSEPKYKLITNHITRKTFITNSIMPGMNTKTIKEITGHKKDSVFNKCMKISEEFKNLEMSRTWDSIPMMGKNPANPKRTKRMNEIEKLLKTGFFCAGEQLIGIIPILAATP